ncbi:unnamed protein product, partial [Symbiodinium microadriaticum]
GEQAEHEEKRYDGTVKCFYGEKHTGHGFIFCPEIYNRTGQDVYLHARQAHRCEVGDEVSFTVVFNSRREPQARSVVKKEEEGKFLSKKREEAERQANALQMKRQRPSMGSAASGASGASAGASSDSVMTEEQGPEAPAMEVAQWYDRQMKVRPLCTKALSSSFLAACSCAVAQALRRRASLRELASFTLQAAPPFGHLWFELLEVKLGPGRILVKTLVDQALFRPVMLLYTFVLGGLLSGQSWAEVRRNVRQNLVQVLVASWKVWPAAVLFTQRFIPRLYQSTFTDVLAFFWDVYESSMISS